MLRVFHNLSHPPTLSLPPSTFLPLPSSLSLLPSPFFPLHSSHSLPLLSSLSLPLSPPPPPLSLSQVENFLLHFWQAMPPHLLPVLASSVVVDLVALCDTLLYSVISSVLIISPIQSFPERCAALSLSFSPPSLTLLPPLSLPLSSTYSLPHSTTHPPTHSPYTVLTFLLYFQSLARCSQVLWSAGYLAGHSHCWSA